MDGDDGASGARVDSPNHMGVKTMAVRTRRSARSASDDTASDDTEDISENTEQGEPAEQWDKTGSKAWQSTEQVQKSTADQMRTLSDGGRKIMSDNLRQTEQVGQSAADNGRKAAWQTAERSSSAALAAFGAFNKPIAKVMDQNRMMFQKMLHAMQEESLRFVNRRLECTSRAIEHSRDCRGVTGLMTVQQEYLMDLARDYAEQTRRLTDLLRELAEDGTAQFSEVAHAVTEPARAMSRSFENRGKSEERAAA
jgi:hypothetical protein